MTNGVAKNIKHIAAFVFTSTVEQNSKPNLTQGEFQLNVCAFVIMNISSLVYSFKSPLQIFGFTNSI
jgi:hypothetical protein